MLASRAAEQEQQDQPASAARQLAGGGAQSLNLLGAASDLIQAGAVARMAGAALPSLASNSDFSSSDSVAVTGQTGTTNPFAGVDFSQMRDNAELNQSLNGGQGGAGGPGGGGPGGGGGFGAVEAGSAAVVAAAEAEVACAATSATSNPTKPHGAIFWNGGNGAIKRRGLCAAWSAHRPTLV